MENEKGFYVALGVYIGELQKRAVGREWESMRPLAD